MNKKLIKWKYKQSINVYEGTIKGDSEPLISIQGGLCVTDLRESRQSLTWVPAKHYKVIGLSIEERKQLAEDLVSGANFEKHEKNRLDWLAENQKTADVIASAQKLINKLKEQNL